MPSLTAVLIAVLLIGGCSGEGADVKRARRKLMRLGRKIKAREQNRPYEQLDEGKVTVVMTSWNREDGEEIKDLKGEEAGAMRDVFDTISAATWKTHSPPTFVAISYQENKAPAPSPIENNFVGLEDYEPVEHHFGKYYGIGGHGATGVMVWVRRDAKARINAVGKFQETPLINSEKGMSVVWVNMAGTLMCFASGHFNTGSKAADYTRLKEYQRFHKLLTEQACDVYFFGADFNWRNGDWDASARVLPSPGSADHKSHYHFVNKAVLAFMEGVEMSGEGVKSRYSDVVSRHNIFHAPKILTNHASVDGKTVFERRLLSELIQGNLLAGPYPALVQPPLLPTFQPAPIGQCQNSKMFCVATKRGGNCNIGGADHWCVSRDRPLTWADEILTWSSGEPVAPQVIPLAYGSLFMPVPSDHFPVFGRYAVDLRLGLRKHLEAVDREEKKRRGQCSIACFATHHDLRESLHDDYLEHCYKCCNDADWKKRYCEQDCKADCESDFVKIAFGGYIPRKIDG